MVSGHPEKEEAEDLEPQLDLKTHTTAPGAVCRADGGRTSLSQSPALGTGVGTQFALFVSEDREDCQGALVTLELKSHVTVSCPM